VVRVLVAGGGTGGHVYPLLAVAEYLRSAGHDVCALGTLSGLEAELVPAAGFRLIEIEKLSFPRRLSASAFRFPMRYRELRSRVASRLVEMQIELVIGFGGYASAPAYSAAARLGIPFVVHEANIRPGLANRLGARKAAAVACAFPGTKLRRAEVVGMPIRPDFLQSLDLDAAQARVELGLDPLTPTLLVTGGSLGAQRINQSVVASVDLIRAAGIQVFHIAGKSSGLDPVAEPGYLRVSYLHRMDVAMAAASFAISRAGASTVAELMLFGVPSLLVPYPVGNGEQQQNAEFAVAVGAAQLVLDRDFDPSAVAELVVPAISSAKRLQQMRAAAKLNSVPDATERLVRLALAQVDT
jgi:UDP-N-acetylglucosamine--N-acetylmuramyl-(pentapeptide) pyrophosphoryl-undecaprenol N-acetylglucosamine transferase